MSETLPLYAEVQPEASPPQYTLPETFEIGHHSVGLLIQPQHLKGHLSLLHAFHTLRKAVETGYLLFPADVSAMEAEQRWGWFVSIAVERFERWCRSLNEESDHNIELALPPVDVVMVWHAYLLNPTWYEEDTARLSSLKFLPIFTDYLTSHIDSPTLLTTTEPYPARIRYWEQTTNTHYDPLEAASFLSHKDIQCPHCERDVSVPFIKHDGTGYAQGNFKVDCSSCGKTITRALLGLYKFVGDVVKTADTSTPEGFLAGTLHTPFEQNDVSRATLIKKRVIFALGFQTTPGLSVKEAMGKWKSDPRLLNTKLTAHLQDRMAKRILSAYSDDRPFSIELVGAVRRQASFVHKMAELGWTEPGFFSSEDDMVVLQHCVARYHAFLGLMADSPGSFFVPTLDIDLAWHTHQLRAKHYRVECKTYVGRYVDHDDKVEEGHLATAFDITCRAWEDRYGLPYSYCGCPLPGTTLAQKLRRALHLNHHHHHHNQGGPNDALRPPPEAEAGTHASDHNAVFPMHDRKASERARELRRLKVARRQRRESKVVGSTTTSRPRDRDHEVAFFYPVPIWYGPACVVAPGIVYEGACATGLGACATGAGACGSGRAACSGSACGGLSTCSGGGFNSACSGGGSTCGGGSSCGGGGGCGGGGCGGG